MPTSFNLRDAGEVRPVDIGHGLTRMGHEVGPKQVVPYPAPMIPCGVIKHAQNRLPPSMEIILVRGDSSHRVVGGAYFDKGVLFGQAPTGFCPTNLRRFRKVLQGLPDGDVARIEPARIFGNS